MNSKLKLQALCTLPFGSGAQEVKHFDNIPVSGLALSSSITAIFAIKKITTIHKGGKALFAYLEKREVICTGTVGVNLQAFRLWLLVSPGALASVAINFCHFPNPSVCHPF
jgi:hypothetical protein